MESSVRLLAAHDATVTTVETIDRGTTVWAYAVGYDREEEGKKHKST